jgi:hypothetical protein
LYLPRTLAHDERRVECRGAGGTGQGGTLRIAEC